MSTLEENKHHEVKLGAQEAAKRTNGAAKCTIKVLAEVSSLSSDDCSVRGHHGDVSSCRVASMYLLKHLLCSSIFGERTMLQLPSWGEP